MRLGMQVGERRKALVLLWDAFRVVFIFVMTVLCIYPFYYVIIFSVSNQSLVGQGVYLWPKGFDLSTYVGLFRSGDIPRAYFITIARTAIGTTIHLFCTFLLAFLMTRPYMPAKKVIYRYFIITMYMGAGILPWYIVMRTYHLDNSFLLYVIPGAVGIYNMILIKTFIEQIPASLEESAALDGAGILTICFRIIMPLSKPILATVVVFNAVGQWNSWQDNFFLVQNPRLQTLQMILQNYLRQSEALATAMRSAAAAGMVGNAEAASEVTPQSVQMATIVVTVIPIMLVYPFAQKYFTKGIMMGAIKG